MPIKANILQKVDTPTDDIIFNDIDLNMKVGQPTTNALVDKENNKDLITKTNFEAVKNSLVNMMLTSPGQKILSPTFGINFGDLLFLPVSKQRGKIIGDTILRNFSSFEPRITIQKINVVADEEQQEYEVDITIIIPDFSNNPLNLKGALSKSGFYTF